MLVVGHTTKHMTHRQTKVFTFSADKDVALICIFSVTMVSKVWLRLRKQQRGIRIRFFCLSHMLLNNKICDNNVAIKGSNLKKTVSLKHKLVIWDNWLMSSVDTVSSFLTAHQHIIGHFSAIQVVQIQCRPTCAGWHKKLYFFNTPCVWKRST